MGYLGGGSGFDFDGVDLRNKAPDLDAPPIEGEEGVAAQNDLRAVVDCLADSRGQVIKVRPLTPFSA